MDACEYTLDKMPVQGEALLIGANPADGLVCWFKPNSGDVVLAPHVNGLAEGTIRTYSKTGSLISLVPYRNGVADGVAQEYYESGELQRELPYKNGVIEGLEKLYDKAGWVFKANLWTDSFNSGTWTKNTDLDGKPFNTCDFKDEYTNTEGIVIRNDQPLTYKDRVAFINGQPANGLACRRNYEKYERDETVLIPFKDGLPDGIVKVYSAYGVLLSKQEYKAGVAGKLKTYDYVLDIDTDIENGITRHYYPNGSLWRELPYKKEKPHGIMKRYGQHGRLIASVEWANGKYASAWTSDTDTDPYNIPKNSDYTSLCNYHDYEIDSWLTIASFEGMPFTGKVCTTPYSDGHVAVIPYVEGIKNGVVLDYFSDGQLWEEIPYKNGKIDGIVKNYTETGWVYLPASLYRDGVKDKNWYSTIDLEGKPIDSRRAKLCDYEESEVIFDNDTVFLDAQPVTGTVCTTSGKRWERVVTVYPLIAGKVEGVVREYIDSQQQGAGNRISETPYKNGKINGVFKSYSYNIISEEINYKNDLKEGIAKTYSEGIISTEMIYVNDLLEGVYKRYYEDGKLWLVQTMKNGKAEGEFNGYDQDDGSIIVSGIYKNDRIISMQCSNGQPLAEKDWDIFAVFDCD
jgi:antitoxin component YwqK of YwqJK toxin-antitoxin module